MIIEYSPDVFNNLKDTETLFAIRWDRITGDYHLVILGQPIKMSTLMSLVATIMQQMKKKIPDSDTIVTAIPEYEEIKIQKEKENNFPPWIKKGEK